MPRPSGRPKIQNPPRRGNQPNGNPASTRAMAASTAAMASTVTIDVNAPTNPPTDNAEDPPTPWGKSKAKEILRQDIISGEINKYKGPTGIFLSRKIFQKYKFTNFSNNYYSLRKSVRSNLQVASAGRQALHHDEPLILEHRQQAGVFHYPGSAVQKALCAAVKAGETYGKTPTQVRAMNGVYQRRGELTASQFSNFLTYERRRFEKKQQEDKFQEQMRFINARIHPEGSQLNEEEEAGNEAEAGNQEADNQEE